MIAGGGKSCRILGAIKGVSKKHCTEKHYFGDKKNPHAKRARLALLLEVLKVMLQRRVACLMFNCNAVCHRSPVSSLKFQVSSTRFDLRAFCLLLSAFCLLPSAFCLLPTAFRLVSQPAHHLHLFR